MCNYDYFVQAAAASTIITQPTDTSAAAPFGGVFTCTVVGYGYQNMTWYKQSGTLPYKHKASEVTSDGVTTSTLIIPNVTEEDVGKYHCQVWANNIGVRSEKANLYYSGNNLLYTYMHIYKNIRNLYIYVLSFAFYITRRTTVILYSYLASYA